MMEWVNTEGTDKFEVVPLNDMKLYMLTAFLLGYYEASSGNSLATFRLTNQYF
jgi:hypothetical protein